MNRREALVASAGWDGDQLVVYDDGEDERTALVWRTVWDRAEDAIDFADHVRGQGEVTVVVDGRVVDLIAAKDVARRVQVIATCAADRVQPEEIASDGVSTAAIEAVIQRDSSQPTSEAGRWIHDAVGLSIPIPEGWVVRELRGTQLLFHPGSRSTTFEANVSVTIQLRGALDSIKASLDEVTSHL